MKNRKTYMKIRNVALSTFRNLNSWSTENYQNYNWIKINLSLIEIFKKQQLKKTKAYNKIAKLKLNFLK